MSFRYVVVIPCRMQSTRMPEKALHKVLGRPLISWVIDGVKASRMIQDIFVATDDDRIRKVVEESGARAIMTDSRLPSGTDRIDSALQIAQIQADFIFNVQGDEPLIDGQLLDQLVQLRNQNPQIEMMTLGNPVQSEDILNKNAVKAVVDKNHDALYFSRFPIPFSRQDYMTNVSYSRVYKHVGLYGYSREALSKICQSELSELEKMESLEQLRALDMGIKIRVYPTEMKFHGVDTLEDVQVVEDLLKKRQKGKGI